jgi:energy-coupling factor transporter transmembrane protein EcfT
MSTPGMTVFQLKFIAVSKEGLLAGALICWQMAAIVVLGFVFVTTTRTSEIKAGVEWFLAPVPLIPEKRVATMISLLVRFLPVVLGQAKETLDAQRARGIENRKNPIYRLTKLSVPLMRRVFESAENLAVAMEARCYSENRTAFVFSSGMREWLALFWVFLLLILMAAMECFLPTFSFSFPLNISSPESIL